VNISPQDQADRIRAATTFDQNVVVTAGAGTGKTTLLINRLLHLLMRGRKAMPVTAIVALTFTNKSANEMKSRLRETLEKLIADQGTSDTAVDLMMRYGLSKPDIDRRAAAAIEDLERSEIGTIHHFAASLLRLYPIEAGVDPQFRIDEGGDLSRQLFASSWRAWLEEELAADSSRKDLWQRVLKQCLLKEIEALAQCLVFEPFHFSKFLDPPPKKEVPLPIVKWLKSLEETADALLRIHPKGRKIEQLLAAAKTCFQEMAQQDKQQSRLSEADANLLLKGNPGNAVGGWEEDEFKTAKNLIKIAKQLLQIDEAFIQVLCEVLKPFVMLFHEKARQEAWVSFDALLVKARDLLRDHAVIREELKQGYQAVLIDEFQDTDPVQYEILIFLAEEAGKAAKHWQAVHLTPGKLFVVGDPKQSIYGFRRADIEAYHAVLKMIDQQGGIHCTLTTNFRSHGKILDVVNGVFERVMVEKTGIQPEYTAIYPPQFEKAIFETQAEDRDLKFRQVSLRLLQNTTEKRRAETARQGEGEAIARWLSQEVLERAVMIGEDGRPRTVKKGDVAILMRTLTGVRYILEPLRRAGIAYWVEGECHFYRQQVVIDAVNLLRTVADANDKLALAAVLRSPVGGLDDEAIYCLEKNGVLNYRTESEFPDTRIAELYDLFSDLHEVAGRLPVAAAVSCIFDRSAMRVFAAAANDGEQALANLEKIEQEAAALSKEENMTFRAVVAALQTAVSAETDAAESPLAEAGIDAVRIFSIHKAKGLEFPLVILAGCQSGPNPREASAADLMHDWSSGLTGLRLGEVRNLNSVFLKEKKRLRELEEAKRLLYVAMTRAREHLMISAAAMDKTQAGSFLSHIETALEAEVLSLLNDSNSGMISMGAGQIAFTVLSEAGLDDVAPVIEGPAVPQPDFRAVASQWEKRFETYALLHKKAVFSSPTELKMTDEILRTRKGSKEKTRVHPHSRDISALLGRLSHRFLETWDFSSDLKNYRKKLCSFLNQQSVPGEDMTQEALFEEMDAIFKVFFFSPAYEALTKVKIVGREVPFLMPWQGQVMCGEIDLIYEAAGQLYIADYKTDRLKKTEIEAAVKKYRHQSRIYPEAVRRALQREAVGMQFIFLRLGLSHFLGRD